MAVLAGLVLNALLGAWWADPLAALILPGRGHMTAPPPSMRSTRMDSQVRATRRAFQSETYRSICLFPRDPPARPYRRLRARVTLGRSGGRSSVVSSSLASTRGD
jgi:hypothetical protein